MISPFGRSRFCFFFSFFLAKKSPFLLTESSMTITFKTHFFSLKLSIFSKYNFQRKLSAIYAESLTKIL